MVLGEIMQKMDSPKKQYGIGLPANKQYANLVNRLPLWMKKQLKLRVFMVKKISDQDYVAACLEY